MAKYIYKANVYGIGGEVIRKAGTSVNIKDESTVDPALFYRAEEQDEPAPEKQLEVATPDPEKATKASK